MTLKERAKKLKGEVPAVYLALTIKLIPTSVWERCCKEAEDMWKDGKPKKWYYALPIVFLWLILIWIIGQFGEKFLFPEQRSI